MPPAIQSPTGNRLNLQPLPPTAGGVGAANNAPFSLNVTPAEAEMLGAAIFSAALAAEDLGDDRRRLALNALAAKLARQRAATARVRADVLSADRGAGADRGGEAAR